MTSQHTPHSWLHEQAGFVRDEIESLLVTFPDEAGLRDIIREALAVPVAQLSDQRPWSLLPSVVCEAMSRRCEQAIPASAALQLFMAAGEVFDDIEDEDSCLSLTARYGRAVATNAATALLILAEREIALLQTRGVPDRVTVHIMGAFNSFYLVACAGQHFDLSLGPGKTLSEEEYLQIALMKSASTIECACHVGALLATPNQHQVEVCTEFGRNLGMASQIANDIQGITLGADIMKRKVTLPVLYVLAETTGEGRNEIERLFRKRCEPMPAPAHIKELLFQSGAVQYAMLKMELYRARALENLAELEGVGATVDRLKKFVE